MRQLFWNVIADEKPEIFLLGFTAQKHEIGKYIVGSEQFIVIN